MAKIPKEIKASESEIYQEIDLADWTGVDVSLDPILAREMQQAIIDYMQGRISQGLGFNKQKLRSPYQDSYADSLDFQAAGKSKGNVNMELSGDMLGSVDVIQERESGAKFRVGFTDSQVIPRAYGHISGFEGHPEEEKMSKYQRVFFGVSEKEFKDEILPAFETDLEELKNREPDFRLEDRIQGSAERQSQLLRLFRTAQDLLEDEE